MYVVGMYVILIFFAVHGIATGFSEKLKLGSCQELNPVFLALKVLRM